MLEFWFQIDLAMPVEMTVELQQDITAAIQPRWRITKIDMRRLEQGLFRLRLDIAAQDCEGGIPEETDLVRFRDLVVSLVAFSTMVPVQLRSKGIFDFPVDGNQRKQTSLGPMNYEFPATPMSELRALVLGLAMEPEYASVLHFLWEALNSQLPLYRFINLAVAVELLVRHDSRVHGSHHPKCGSAECDYQLDKCPKCGRCWLIPSTLRERAAFLLPDDQLQRFITVRNQVFHGLLDRLHRDYPEDLPALNRSLLVTVRNYVGEKMGLSAISKDRMSIALDPPDITMSVSYTLPASDGQL